MALTRAVWLPLLWMTFGFPASGQNGAPDSTWVLPSDSIVVDAKDGRLDSTTHDAADSSDTQFWIGGSSRLRFAVIPIIFSSPDTRIGIGAVPNVVFHTSEEARSSNSRLEATYTQNHQFNLRLSSSVWLPANRYRFEVRLQFQDWPTSFYGIGNNVSVEQSEKYASRIFITTAEIQRRIAPDTYAGFRHDIRKDDIHSVEEVGQLAEGGILGSDGGFSSGIGAFVGYDTRDHVLYPTDGQFVQVGTRLFYPAWGSEFEYARHRIEARTYHTVDERRVVAGQFVAAFASGDPPFQMYSTVGELLRAYGSSRYIDRNMLAARVEYRHTPVFWRFGYALFVGGGRVGPDFGNFDLGSAHLSAGAGIRFQIIPSEQVVVRWDFAVGTRTTGTHLDFGEAF